MGITRVGMDWGEGGRIIANQHDMMKNLCYRPTVSAALVHLLLFAAVVLVFFARKFEALRFEVINRHCPDFHLHISNFAICYLIISGVGFIWLFMGVSVKHVAVFALAMLAIDVVYELWIPIINVPDPIDAYYGFWGCLLAFTEMYGIQKWGLVRVAE